MRIEKLSPAFKDYLWGGTKLKTEFGKQSDLDIVAESWELSTHTAGESHICGGPSNGMTLSEYLKKAGPAALGKNAAAFENFPVLIKFIDAAKPLSVQVHPSDEYACAWSMNTVKPRCGMCSSAKKAPACISAWSVS